MESRPPNESVQRWIKPPGATTFSIMSGVGLLFCCLLAASGCSFDDSALFENAQGIECDSVADCPNQVSFACVDNRCVSVEYLNDAAAERFDAPNIIDGEVFDPTGLSACGPATNVVFCAEDQACCDGECRLIQTDSVNCGACGFQCLDNETCVGGTCLCAGTDCADEEICCDSAGTLSCVNPTSDKENCGGCSTICDERSNEGCLDGQCGCLKKNGTDPLPTDDQIIELCATGFECCPPRPEYPNEVRGCVDTNTVEDCGGCGNKCGEGEQCINGQCACGQARPSSADGLGAVCDTGEACCFSPNGQQICRPQADCKCGGTLNQTTGQIEGGTTCTGVQICCHVDLPGLPARPEPTCVDPTKDAENCGGCVLTSEDPLDANNLFRCQPGQLCIRNFEYSLGRPPEEQNAEGIYIGTCKLTCSLDRVQCPGGDDETGVPYTQDRQSCIDPLSSLEFCGALPRRDDASAAGQCSTTAPVTFGELRNFKGVRCGAGQTCRAKLQCPNPTPFPGTEADGVTPCDPRKHYYYDVAKSSDAEFPAGTLLPSDAVFNPAVDVDSYVENQYLRAVCDTTCSDTTARCINANGDPVCVDPSSSAEFCGALANGDCSGDVDATGAPGPLGGDNNGVNCNALPNVSGASCSAGSCANLNCDPGFGDCNADPDDGCETDLLTSPVHCGQCNAACQPSATVSTATCASGQCHVICAAGQSNCQNSAACNPAITTCDPGETVDVLVGTTRDGCETTTDSDKLNCGACNNVCENAAGVTTASCVASTCDISICDPGKANCDSDPANGCETSSTQAEFCNATDTCLGPSTPGTTTISGDRARPNSGTDYINCSDPASFGGDTAASWSCVRNTADTAFECRAGTCGVGFSACDPSNPATCFPLNTTSNCSTCGNICGTGAVCTGSTSSDDCKCTATGEQCRATGINYNSASCSGTDCVLVCATGFADCDGNPANGCETDTNADTNHCGGCNATAVNPGIGLVCGSGAACIADASGPNGRACHCGATGDLCTNTGTSYTSASCSGTSCILGCSPGFADCNSTVADGCEVNIATPNDTHCGGCSTDANGVPIATSQRNCANVNGGVSQCGGADAASFHCMFCGDTKYDGNRTTPAEACDDGNLQGGDGCSATCTLEAGFTCTQNLDQISACAGAGCGNGFLNSGEACDDGNVVAGDGCNAACSIEFAYSCTTNPTPNPPTTVASTCTRVCGDGQKAAEEACDDGDTTGGDGCSATCTVETGFACTGTAPSICNAICGNGVRHGPETCDDGDAISGDGCSSSCQAEPGYSCTTANPNVCTLTCSNGTIVSPETCDDGNLVGGDGCSASCQTESGYTCSGSPSICNTSCGDGIRAGTEVCDTLGPVFAPGTTCPSAGFSDNGAPDVPGCSSCTAITQGSCGPPSANCGNGLVDATEQCDGANLASQTCQTQGFASGSLSCGGGCLFVTSSCNACGNGRKDGAEVCDDGNQNSGDGCSNVCGVEAGFTCVGAGPGSCSQTCGNGVINSPGEQCDGTNLANQTCQTLGFASGTLSCGGTCQFVTTSCNACGNGTVNSGEVCDGTNLNGQTCVSQGSAGGGTLACNANCLTFNTSGCFALTCGNGVIDAGEACDTNGASADILPGGTTCVSAGFVNNGAPDVPACNSSCTGLDVGSCGNSQCGNSLINSGESCDVGPTAGTGDDVYANGDNCVARGFTAGTLTCTACAVGTGSCTGLCGNGEIDSGEDCDGANHAGLVCADFGFTGGSLTCTSCVLTTGSCTGTCGNGDIDSGEVCDGTNIGGRTCAQAGFSGSGIPTCNANCLSFQQNDCGAAGVATCGNNIKETGEACDGTDFGAIGTETIVNCTDLGYPAAGTLACNSNCTFNTTGCTAASCNGSNSASSSEPCDDDGTDRFKNIGGVLQSCTAFGYSGGTLGCTRSGGNCSLVFTGCTAPNLCGNSAIDSGEDCDGTNLAGATCDSEGFTGGGTLSCSSCAFVTTGCFASDCGNNVIDSGETCDIGANAGSAADDILPNGITCSTAGFSDDASPNVPGCNPTCTGYVQNSCASGLCGNGVINSGEDCDGTNFGGYACSDFGFTGGTLTCTACALGTGSCTGLCGNGVINSGEACDDGNAVTTDGCNACAITAGFTCTGAPSVCTANCGNGTINSGEACDDGDASSGDGCSATCTVEAGFTCTGAPSVCTANCGNSVIDNGEACDDGDVSSGDGCSATCTVEAGFTCTGAPSVCTANCGNGTINSGEACDDGDASSGDGCSATCTVEAGFSCSGVPSTCVSLCGNGVIDAGEACDPLGADVFPAGLDCRDFGYPAAGTMNCTANCDLTLTGCDSTSCGNGGNGNGTIDAGEACDPQVVATFPAWLSGCTDLGYSSGLFTCTTGSAGTGCEIDLTLCIP